MTQAVPGMAAIRHAVENACIDPPDEQGIIAILQGEGGDPSHLHAVFGDASLRMLESAAAAQGISLASLFLAYQAAQRTAAVANPELDALLADPW